MDAWVWFVIAAVAGVGGVALLLLDRGHGSSQGRERRRWAALRGWQFADSDDALPDRWRHGAVGSDGGAARNVVTGSLFTAAGRRLVHVFDHEKDAATASVVTAVHRRAPQPVVLEMWLPRVEFPADAGLDLLGPVGDRYAFASDLAKARPLITPEFVELTKRAGEDVPVLWIEDAWVAAAVPPGTGPAQLERLLRLLGDLADLVDGVHPAGRRERVASVSGEPEAGTDVGPAAGAGSDARSPAGERTDADVPVDEVPVEVTVDEGATAARATEDVVDAEIVDVVAEDRPADVPAAEPRVPEALAAKASPADVPAAEPRPAPPSPAEPSPAEPSPAPPPAAEARPSVDHAAGSDHAQGEVDEDYIDEEDLDQAYLDQAQRERARAEDARTTPPRDSSGTPPS